MNSTKYSNFCLRTFGKFFSAFKKDKLEEKNLMLVKADIRMSYDEYYAMTIMNMLLGFIVSFIITLILFFFLPSSIATALFILMPPLITILIGAIYYYLPNYYIGSRGKNIDLFLPYAINFISSMAVAGISPSEIFQALSSISVYGEVQNEAKKIAKEITVMGIDNITALKHAIDVSPSKKFKAFLQGIVGTIQSGSDLHVYLSSIAQKYLADDLIDRKKDLDLLEVIAEIMVLSVIAFPIFLVIILTVMGFFGGSMESSLLILNFISFLLLPIIYILFYFLISSTSAERLTKIELGNLNIKQRYQNNKTALLIFSLSAMGVAVFYGIARWLGYFDTNPYFYWDFIFLSLVILMGPLGIYKYLELKKKKEMQQRLPDFLTEIGDSLSTGMNIFDAIKIAEKANYGRLSPEIKKMKAQLSWNVSIKNVLFDFAGRMKSAIVQRVIILINKGLLMGGNTPKIFKAAAEEVNQVNQIENQRKSIMSIYALVILICFFVFLAIIFILDKTIFASFLDVQTKQVTRIGSVQFNSIDPSQLKYALFSFVYVQSIGAGIIAGYMTDGKLSSGVRYSCLLVIVSFLAFKFLF